jgi:MFS family permease
MKEVGIIDAVAFMIGILLEFPSGIVSDRLGRKQTLFLSQSLQLLGSLLITFASNLYEIGFGFVVFQMGVAFYSGTIESFGYESCLKEKLDYTKVLVKSGIFSNVAFLGSLLVGGYLYSFNPIYPNILFSLNFLIGFISLFLIKEVSQLNLEKDFLLSKSKLNFQIIISFIILMVFVFAFDYGFLKLYFLEKFTDISKNHWYIFVSTVISLYISSKLLPKIESFGKVLVICFFILILALILSFYSFVPVFFILSFYAVFIYQLSLKYLNERISDSKRASAISLFNLIYKLPYVLIALVLGYNLA